MVKWLNKDMLSATKNILTTPIKSVMKTTVTKYCSLTAIYIQRPYKQIKTSGTSGTAGGFICSDKTTCGQMGNYSEARFYLNTCGIIRLDGDKDGIPCETPYH